MGKSFDMSSIRSEKLLITYAIFALGMIACSHMDSGPPSAQRHRAPTATEVPATVRVEGGDVDTRFTSSAAPAASKVDAFRITKSPPTVGQLEACVSAGACPSVDAASCESTSPAEVIAGTTTGAAMKDLPATCVRRETAEAYCAWVGGSLPTRAQWFAAARGSEFLEFPWGNDAPTCDRHPVVDGMLASSQACCPPGVACDPRELGRVGMHPAGASPSGVEDVLLAGGELIQGDVGLTGCADAKTTCLITGARGHARGVRTLSADDAAPVYAFRCVLGAK